jgi:oligopeptide transport system substrate-binding protein
MIRSLLCGITVVLFFTTCHDSNSIEDTRSVFNYNEIAGVSSLDPAAASNTENIWAVNQLFSGLVQTDEKLNVVPAIAKTYSISNDGLTYTFLLRNDVYFHDDDCFENKKGRKVIARDVEYSFNRLYDGRVSSAMSLLTNIDRSEKTNFKGFTALNDSVFQIYLKSPFSAFLNVLTMKFFSVLPHEAIDKYKLDFRRNPVGTGPFCFKHWEEGNKLILTRNTSYFEKDEQGNSLPYLDAVTISFMKDRETSFMELLNGKFDMLSGADAMNINEVLDKNGELRDVYAAKFYLQKQDYLKTDYIGILIDEKIDIVKNSPLKHKAIRQAINYGFDRKAMIKFLRNNVGVPANAGFIPKGLKSYDENLVKGYTYDADKVRMLLEEAGYAGGKGLPEITLHTTENFKELLEYIQSQLAQNNIKVAISIEKSSVLRQAVSACQYMLFKKSWVADYADEENYFSLFYGNNFAPEGFNFFHYKNEKFDALFEKALKEQSREVKTKMYQEMDNMLIQDAPVIPLFYDQVIRLVNKNVSGLPTNAMNLLDLRRVKK